MLSRMLGCLLFFLAKQRRIAPVLQNELSPASCLGKAVYLMIASDIALMPLSYILPSFYSSFIFLVSPTLEK
jgi:hypothetical protein